jgi:hypothetical protein
MKQAMAKSSARSLLVLRMMAIESWFLQLWRRVLLEHERQERKILRMAGDIRQTIPPTLVVLWKGPFSSFYGQGRQEQRGFALAGFMRQSWSYRGPDKTFAYCLVDMTNIIRGSFDRANDSRSFDY